MALPARYCIYPESIDLGVQALIGQTLSHYRIVEKLGAGGMGEVYRARDAKLGREVALKVLPSEMASDPERLERFEREARAVAALNHPNIVTVFSVEETDDSHYFTMELVEGESLENFIPEDGMPIARLLEIAVPMADALADAHEQGIIHRDLKPANIMVDSRGRPKILDFGLAKLRPHAPASDLGELPTEAMTRDGSVLGTYPYMSPEQAQGKPVDPRSDLFSLGIILYEMATGERPFEGENPVSLISSIIKDDPRPVAELRPELPEELGGILSRCLEKDPDHRYPRAEDLKQDLADLQRGSSTTAATALAFPPPAAGRRKPGRLLGLLVAVLLLVAGAVYLGQRGDLGAFFGKPRITALAVLPLDNLSGDSDLDYFAAGVTEGLISNLSHIEAVRVISRQSVIRYKDSDLPLPEIAAELNVQAVVQGSVMPVNDRVRVAAQLVRADPERHLWADEYERDAGDILALLSDVTRAIVDEIEVVLSEDEQARLASVRTVDPKAHRAYLRGIHHMHELVPEELAKSAEFLRESLAIDPTYAPAWAGLARHYTFMISWGLPANAEQERLAAWNETAAALAKALDLDSSLSLAHQVKAFMAFQFDWDWPTADAGYQRAIELEPNNSDRHITYAFFLSAMGRHEEANREAELAEQLDPFSPYVLRLRGDIHRYAGDFEAAIAIYERALKLIPTNLFLQFAIVLTLPHLERYDEAGAIMRRALGNVPTDATGFDAFDQAMRFWLRMVTEPTGMLYGQVDPTHLARSYALLGDDEEALKLLETAYEMKGNPRKAPGYVFPFIAVDPALEGLRDEPRFQELLRKMNLAG